MKVLLIIMLLTPDSRFKHVVIPQPSLGACYQAVYNITVDAQDGKQLGASAGSNHRYGAFCVQLVNKEGA